MDLMRADLLTRILTTPWTVKAQTNARVLYVLLEASGPLNKTTIMKRSGVSGNSLNKTLPMLKKYGLITQFKKGNGKMSQINDDNDIIKALRKLKIVCDEADMVHSL